jgi:hypothetical protein
VKQTSKIWQLGLWIALVILGVGCAPRVRDVARLPVQIEIEFSGNLQVVVVGATKRSLAAAELPPSLRAGSRWEYTVRFADTVGVGVRFQELRSTVRSLAGAATTRTIPLGSRVEPNGMTRILVSAELSTSDPGEPENLAGVQELLFIGRDDLGGPVRILVRVPLE